MYQFYNRESCLWLELIQEGAQCEYSRKYEEYRAEKNRILREIEQRQ